MHSSNAKTIKNLSEKDHSHTCWLVINFHIHNIDYDNILPSYCFERVWLVCWPVESSRAAGTPQRGT